MLLQRHTIISKLVNLTILSVALKRVSTLMTKSSQEFVHTLKVCAPLEDRTDENGVDTLKIRKGIHFPGAVLPWQSTPSKITMRYS